MTRPNETYYGVSADSLAVLAEHIAKYAPKDPAQKKAFIRSAIAIADATYADAKLCDQGPRQMFTPTEPKERA